MMILHMCIVYDPRKHHFDFGFKGQGLEFELYIGFFFVLFFWFVFWEGGGGEDVKCKCQICYLHIAMFLHNNYITLWHMI